MPGIPVLPRWNEHWIKLYDEGMRRGMGVNNAARNATVNLGRMLAYGWAKIKSKNATQ